MSTNDVYTNVLELALETLSKNEQNGRAESIHGNVNSWAHACMLYTQAQKEERTCIVSHSVSSIGNTYFGEKMPTFFQ